MAIVKMNKFTLLAFESQKEKLLESLQSFENIHFINLQDADFLEKNEEYSELRKDTPDEKISIYQEYVSKLKFTLDFLESYIPKKPMLKALREGKKSLSFSELKAFVEKNEWTSIYENIKAKEQELNSLKNDYIKYETEIQSLLPWVNFDSSFDSLKTLKRTSYFIGTISVEVEEELFAKLKTELPNSYFEVLNRTNEDTYILVLASRSDEESVNDIIKQYGFSSLALNYSGIPGKIVEDFKVKLCEIKKASEEIKGSIKSFEDKVEILQLFYEYYSNEILKLNAASNFLKTSKVVTISGWCPVEVNESMEHIVKSALSNEYILDFNEVTEEEIEEVPVRLKNSKIVSPFEAITEMYSLPKYNEIDPTPLLAPFYFLFFGMMVADAGYGIIVFIGCIIALKYFNFEAKMRKFVEFFFYLSISTTIFGALYGSYFGDAIKIPGLINPNKDINTILIMSLVFGIIHIFFGLGVKAYIFIRDGQYRNALYDVGSWVLTLVGAGLFGAGNLIRLPAVGIEIAKYSMFAGMVLIIITQGRFARSYGAKLGSGLYALYGITNYIGDLVSYTRLMALGLAGGSIAGALNLIISFFPGVSLFIVGPIFFLLAQIFNLLLSLLGAYVHTCRLQYVEFFSKFYEGGGKAFESFRPLNKYIELKRD